MPKMANFLHGDEQQAMQLAGQTRILMRIQKLLIINRTTAARDKAYFPRPSTRDGRDAQRSRQPIPPPRIMSGGLNSLATIIKRYATPFYVATHLTDTFLQYSGSKPRPRA